MGDVGDYWRDVREHYRSQGKSRPRRKKRAELVRFTKKHEAAGWEMRTEWHWQMRINGELLDYWPSKSKWQFRGEVQTGDVAAFIATQEGQ